MEKILLASDLDRTILPNGPWEESPEARPRLRQLVQRPEITLVYISGRNKDLLQEAITEYDLPLPVYAIGDVGTTIYEVGKKQTWRPLIEWEQEIAPDWNEKTWPDVKVLFDDISTIRLQDDSPAFQNTYKVSYYTNTDIDRDKLLAHMEQKARNAKINASFIWSVDELKHVGLLDVLPKSATKIHALQFLRERLKFTEDQTIFCGDSGNDIPALTSGLKSVMVKNTRPEVQQEVANIARQQGITNRVYTARGEFLNMNGNYTAGVIEGIAHFFPSITDWID